MPNILVIDSLQETGALIKSFLGRYYGVSLSEDFSEAQKKVETALFDAVVMEIERLNFDIEKFITETKGLLPQLPIMVITEHDDKFQSLGCSRVITRPFRCAGLMDSIAECLAGVQAAVTPESATYHHGITYNVEVSAASDTLLKCSVADLSLLGMIIAPMAPPPGRNGENERANFNQFFQKLCPENKVYGKPLKTEILLKNEERFRLDSRIAFVEPSPDETYKKVGLIFKGAAEQKSRLLELLKPA